MAKKILLMMRRNSMTLLGAAILASGIFYVVNNPEVFMTSILSLQEQEFITKKAWDIAYKTNNGYVDIFIAEKIKTIEKIDFTIIFNKDTVMIDPQNLTGQGIRRYELPDDESVIIQFTPNATYKTNESLLMLPFTGNMEHILVSEAIANNKGLAIGSLNDFHPHSQ